MTRGLATRTGSGLGVWSKRVSHSSATGLLGFVLVFSCTGSAHARRNGIFAEGCWGCHGTSDESTLTFATDHEPILPGETVTFTATIAWEHASVGGIFVIEPNVGELLTMTGQGLTLAEGSLTHSSPKAAVDGKVTFEFQWKAPAEPGALLLGAYALAGNGDRRNSGDAPGQNYVNLVFGCEPKDFFYDADGDGHGTPDPAVADRYVSCADQPAPAGYAPLGDDCDDLHARVFPGASERCNDEDDNCNGEIDENTSPETLWPDPDGDGFYGNDATETIIGCLPLEGYAVESGDCAPADGARFPGAEEICNLLDDDCDFRVDEDVRPRCGIGRCERESETCDPADCVAAPPMAESCNGLDDDCDDDLDEEEPCGEGRVCLGISCVALVEEGTAGAAGEASAPAPGAMAPGASGAGGTRSGASGSEGGVTASAGGNQEPVAPDPEDAGGHATSAKPSPGTSSSRSACGLAHGEPSSAPVWGIASLLALGLRRRRR